VAKHPVLRPRPASPSTGAREAIGRLVAGGGRIAWGVAAPHRTEHALHVVKRLQAALDAVAVPGEQSMLTASCGTGRVSARREAEIAVALADTARTMRRAQSPHSLRGPA
jgi:hypothetical protein